MADNDYMHAITFGNTTTPGWTVPNTTYPATINITFDTANQWFGAWAYVSQDAKSALDWLADSEVELDTAGILYAQLEHEAASKAIAAIISYSNVTQRQIVGIIPYGSQKLKAKLIERGLTPTTAGEVISELKKNGALYQIGRGTGKMFALLKRADGGHGDMTDAGTVIAPPNAIITTPQTPPQVDRVQAWLKKWGPDQNYRVTRTRTPKIKTKIPTIKFELPPIEGFIEFEEIFARFSDLFAGLIAEVNDKCKELQEENMVLNQATWQS